MVKQTSIEIRKLVVKLYQQGEKYRKIAEIVGRTHSTIEYIIKKFKESGSVENKKRNCTKKILTDREERWIVNEIRQNPLCSAVKLANEVEKQLKKKVSAETVRRALRKYGYNGRVARKKPYISDKNRVLRRKFAKTYSNKQYDFWSTVIFADESKFNLSRSDGRVNVWRKENQEFNPKNFLPTFKHGGGSVMVWGCMSAIGVGKLAFIDGIMDKWKYLEILKANLPASASKLGLADNFKYYQDNDPKHMASVNILWCLYNCSKVIKSPPQSPYLNVIENLWDDLERRIKKHNMNRDFERSFDFRMEFYRR